MVRAAHAGGRVNPLLIRAARPPVGVIALILIALALRLAFIDQPMRYDEALTFLRYASRPLPQALSTYDEPNNHLLHTFLMHIAWQMLGDSPFALRFPALAAGLLLVPLTYAAGAALDSRRVGLLAAGIVASSSALIEYSSNGRGYTLACCWFLLLLILALRIRNHFPPPHDLGAVVTRADRPFALLFFLYALTAALALYTIPSMLHAVGIVSLWLLLSTRLMILRWLVPALLAAALLTLLLYLPVFLVSGLESVTANRYVSPLSWQTFQASVPIMLDNLWRLWNRDYSDWLAFGLATASLSSVGRALLPLSPLMAAVLWLTPALLIQRVVGFPRTWLFLLPLVLITAAGGICWLLERFFPSRRQQLALGLALAWALGAGLGGLQSGAVLRSQETGVLPSAEAWTLLLQTEARPDDAILAPIPASAPLEYYFRRHNLPGSFINTDIGEGARLLVVVYHNAAGLEKVLADAGLSMDAFRLAALLAADDVAALYRLEPAG